MIVGLCVIAWLCGVIGGACAALLVTEGHR